MSQMKNVLFQCADGRHFCYSDSKGMLEVNMFRPRMSNPDKKDVEIELKIVPARFVEDSLELMRYVDRGSGDSYSKQDEPLGNIPAVMLQVPGNSNMDWYKGDPDSPLDIEAVINEEEDEPTANNDNPDEIYIAIADLVNFDTYDKPVELTSGGSFTHAFTYPRPLLRERTMAPLSGDIVRNDQPYSLSLIPIAGEINLASQTLHKDFKVQTRVRHCFKFVSSILPDVSALFIFHNKKFVCEKIEVDITVHGLSKLFTGYFYEVD